MNTLAIIGGSGLSTLESFASAMQVDRDTPFGYASGPITRGRIDGRDVIFLPRHGRPHAIPPHRVNYRANLWALREAGARHVIAVNAVGGITGEMRPRRLCIPDQIVDYTHSRAHTLFDETGHAGMHVDFTRPYTEELRAALLASARKLRLDVKDGGTYGATQGPRLESAAEIRRMERDGCDLVGMTGMPEAGLARELGLGYASLCVVANRAAGKSPEPITSELLEENLKSGMQDALKLLRAVILELVGG
jgi:5'-deoxy-5'-methylthioadenosine phosphorylase